MMNEKIYRISWEMVLANTIYKYSNEDPASFINAVQVVPNSEIPDEDWNWISREDTDPWDQYHRLKEWAAADTGFIRNVRLEVQVVEPVWAPADE